MKPKYTHDCTYCKFLGQHNGFDLYQCGKKNDSLESFIARYGDEGYQYASAPRGVIERSYIPEIHIVGKSPHGLAIIEAFNRSRSV